MGFHAMIVDNLKIPFVTSVLGIEVTVEHMGLGEDNSILAVCARGGIRQAVRVWIFRCQSRRLLARSGSMPIGTGWAEQHGEDPEVPSVPGAGLVEAPQRYHLSHAQVQMARELGLNPRKLGKIVNHQQEPWKAHCLSSSRTSTSRGPARKSPQSSRRPRDGRGRPRRGRRRPALQLRTAAVSSGRQGCHDRS